MINKIKELFTKEEPTDQNQKPEIRTEVRKNEHGVDEVLLYVNDECVFHMERMSEETLWMALYSGKETRDVGWISSISGRAKLKLEMEEE